MKKSLVALATLAATGAVMAQATIYGRSDIGYGVKATQMGTGGTGVKQLGVMDGGNAGSRIGFRGTEDLGGGMKAHFVTEQGISPTNGALFGVRTGNIGIQYDGYASVSGNDPGTGGGYTQGTNRQSYVALEGGFGTVRVGYQYTAAYEVASLSGFTNTSEGVAGGSIAHLWGTGVAGGTRGNGINYISPKLAGAWTVGIQMGSTTGRENTEFVGSTNTANGRLLDKAARTSLHIDYNAGPLRAAFAYTTLDQNAGGALANNAAGALGAVNTVTNTFNVYGALTTAGAAVATTNVATQTNLSQLAGTYDFGMIKLGATINSGQSTATTTTIATLATAASVTNISSRAVSAVMPMGNLDIVGGFNNASLDVAGAPTADWASSQLGLKYNFSKRTIMYGYTGTSTNNLATTATAVKVITGTIIGIDHQF